MIMSVYEFVNIYCKYFTAFYLESYLFPYICTTKIVVLIARPLEASELFFHHKGKLRNFGVYEPPGCT